MSEAAWTLADAPELYRARAICDAARAVSYLADGLQALHRDDWNFYEAPRQFRLANYWADCAVECAARYRVAKDALSEIRNTLYDFDCFCCALFGPVDDYCTIGSAATYHADMLEESDFSDCEVPW